MSALKHPVTCLVLAAALAVPVVAQAPVTIGLATAAPVNSSWHKALLDMGADWAAKTQGRVKLTVFAGGIQGPAASTILRMRAGQLQANLLMVAELAQIDEAFNVFGLPFFFQSDEEALHVQQRLTPVIEQRLDAKGFRLLSWGNAGWVQLFSKQQLRTLDDVKKAKLFTSQGDDRMVQWYKSNGFHPVAISANDIPAQLKIANGMIDTAPSPPYLALVLQIFRDAKFMLDVRVAPLLGALVMTNTAWNKIGPADRAVITETARGFERRIAVDAPKQDAESVATMKTRGLTVTTLDPKAAAEFRTAAEKLVATMEQSGMVPPDVYKLAVQERDAFRKSKGR